MWAALRLHFMNPKNLINFMNLTSQLSALRALTLSPVLICCHVSKPVRKKITTDDKPDLSTNKRTSNTKKRSFICILKMTFPVNRRELSFVVKALIVKYEIFTLFLGRYENTPYICDTNKRTFFCIQFLAHNTQTTI